MGNYKTDEGKETPLTKICGHYEGFDERIRQNIDCEEISIGDYVLTGGELPAMVVTDAICRYLDGVIADDSLKDESFTGDLLEYPQYTRPEVWRDKKVPEVLLSGHHKRICEWKREMSIVNTFNKRRGMLSGAKLTDKEKKLVEELKKKSAQDTDAE